MQEDQTIIAPVVETTPAPKAAAKPKKVAAPKTPVAAKPSIEKYAFRSTWTGPSDAVNKNLSRTKIDPAKFNAFPKAAVTARDQAAIVALRAQFGQKPWERKNMDAGIVRRLMERGFAKHVDGDPSSLTGRFCLTKAGMGLPLTKTA